MIYFDNAATSYPKPDCVTYAAAFSAANHGNPGRGGYKLSMDAAEAVYTARCRTAEFFGSHSPERVIFTLNATYALNMALNAFAENARHMLISCFEHNSVLRPAEKLKESGCEYDIFDTDMTDDDKTVENVIAKLRADTKLVVITHVSNICGKILPVERIINAVKSVRKDIFTVVDAAQSAGVIDVNINKMGADAICVPAHKGLLGITGCGALIFADWVDLRGLPALISGGSGTNSTSRHMPEEPPERFEAGTLNVPAIWAMNAGIKYVSEIGTQIISNMEYRLYDYAFAALECMKNIRLYSFPPRFGYTGSILFNVEGQNCDKIADYLSKRGICVRAGIHCSPLGHAKLGTIETGAVRISFGCHNTQSQINSFLNVIESAARA